MSIDLKDLKAKVDRVASLLADPHPGLFTWSEFLGKAMDDLVESWPVKASRELAEKLEDDFYAYRPGE